MRSHLKSPITKSEFCNLGFLMFDTNYYEIIEMKSRIIKMNTFIIFVGKVMLMKGNVAGMLK